MNFSLPTQNSFTRQEVKVDDQLEGYNRVERDKWESMPVGTKIKFFYNKYNNNQLIPFSIDMYADKFDKGGTITSIGPSFIIISDGRTSKNIYYNGIAAMYAEMPQQVHGNYVTKEELHEFKKEMMNMMLTFMTSIKTIMYENAK